MPGLCWWALVLVTVAGCTTPAPDPPRTLSASSLRGLTSDEAYARLRNAPGAPYPDGLGVVTYDLAYLVSDGEPPPPQPTDLVVAACFTDQALSPAFGPAPRIVLGVIPAGAVTPAVRDRARARGFDAEIAECPGTSDTFEVPPG